MGKRYRSAGMDVVFGYVRRTFFDDTEHCQKARVMKFAAGLKDEAEYKKCVDSICAALKTYVAGAQKANPDACIALNDREALEIASDLVEMLCFRARDIVRRDMRYWNTKPAEDFSIKKDDGRGNFHVE